MKMRLKLLVSCAGGALLSGCVAIPCGTQTFTTEYPTEIRAADEKPTKEYEASVAATTPGEDGKVGIGLACEITTTQARVQHYNSVSLTKSKRIAIGVFTGWAEEIYHPKDGLEPVFWPYLGNGRYSSDTFGYDLPGAFVGGSCLNALTLGLLPIPFVFLEGIFGPFEQGHHYLGKVVETKTKAIGPKATKTTTTHSSADLELLAKFSAEDRERIGAWTWMDDDKHPQNTFWFGFTTPWPRKNWPWPGASKYCTYVVHDPVELEKTTPVAPTVTRDLKAVTGPYGVFLRIPDVEFTRTLAVPRGETAVEFDLADLIGKSAGEGYVRFLPPSGGLEEAWDDDARILLEQIQGRDFAVDLGLPLPRLSGEDR